MSHIEGSAPPPLSAHGFVRFYTPLAATSLLLTATTPILTAALARSADPVTALAGYGVAFAVCGVLYAPLLVIQQVAAARLLAGGSFAPVKRFACLTGGLLSVLGLVIAHTLIGDVVFGTMVGVEGAVQDEASLAMAFLWPIPFLTAVRAAHQGRLVAGHRTLPIAWATGGRTGVLGVVAFGLLATGGGAWLGAMAFTAGLAFETCVVWASPTPGLPPEREGGEADQKSIALFSAPLMLNVFLWWATPLVINATLARTSDPAPALAAFAVVEAVAWFIAAPVGQLQHASIALVRCSDTHRRVQAWGCDGGPGHDIDTVATVRAPDPGAAIGIRVRARRWTLVAGRCCASNRRGIPRSLRSAPVLSGIVCAFGTKLGGGDRGCAPCRVHRGRSIGGGWPGAHGGGAGCEPGRVWTGDRGRVPAHALTSGCPA